MPIVNGIYVNDQLPAGGNSRQSGWIDQAFGPEKYSGKDWSDVKTAAYNYLLKQQENAYNLELWNLANEYNSPASQMQRYQDAGLNPNLVYSQQNTTSPLSAAQNQAFRSQGTYAKKVQNQLATINEIQGLVKSAAETYDYVRYGAPTHAANLQNAQWSTMRTQEQALSQHLQNEWDQLLLEGPSSDPDSRSYLLGHGPRYELWKTQKDTAQQNYERMKYMVASMLPTQKARQDALTELDKYQLEFMQGKYEAVLDVDLGLGEKVNQWARMLMFIALAQMM